MSENENCPCLEYKSVPNGEWSQCILESSSHHSSSSARSRFCGIGKRYRRLDCLNSNNHIVDIKWVVHLLVGPNDICVLVYEIKLPSFVLEISHGPVLITGLLKQKPLKRNKKKDRTLMLKKLNCAMK